MGYRTVVMLYNDQAGQWTNDPDLGLKISRKMNFAMGTATKPQEVDLSYGRVIHCQHADCQELGVFDSYRFTPLAAGAWRPGEETEAMALRMLKEAAEKIGYRLVKRPA